MELGQPKHLVKQGGGGGISRVRLQEGENIHRVLYGPVRVSLQYYPTLIPDDTTGEMVQRMKVIRRPESGTPLDTLASLEKRVRASRGEKDPSSSLNPSNKWLYSVIDRNDPDYPTVKVAEYPFTVRKPLEDLEGARSTKDAAKLRHGLIFMWDAIITKTVDMSKGIRFGTKYSVEVDPENQYAGKVPVQYLGCTTTELTERGLKFDRFFTPEEFDAINDSDLNLEDVGRPESHDEITAKLQEFPIFLGANNPDGSYRFPSVEKFQEQLDKMGLQYLEGEESSKPKAKRIEAKVTEEEVESETEEITFEEGEEEEVKEDTPSSDSDSDDDDDFPEW